MGRGWGHELFCSFCFVIFHCEDLFLFLGGFGGWAYVSGAVVQYVVCGMPVGGGDEIMMTAKT